MKQTFKQHLIFPAYGYSALTFHAFYDWNSEKWVHNPENLHTDEGVCFDDLNVMDQTALLIAIDKLGELLDDPEEEEEWDKNDERLYYGTVDGGVGL